jgi:drug/metabolite transporter (DMT)-like permease
LISCVTNGISPIIQTAQQQEYQTKYGSEMMMVALFFVFVVYLFFALFNEKKERKTALPSALIWGSLAGLCTGLLNFLVIIFTGQLLIPLSIFFPLISGGNLLVTFALGFFVLKEKYTLIQYVGLACGLISVVLLNV